MKTYGMTAEEIGEIAHLIGLLDHLVGSDQHDTKSAIDRAHATIVRVLGADAHLVYDQEVA